jgi:2-polyprenyl-6-methoxyphenol hydroxylase-like FAD-dependent oxidoreductase
MNPSGGLGGIHAIHDAVALANWMSTLRLADEEKLGKVFKKYRKERYPVAKAAFEISQMFTHNFGKVIDIHYFAILRMRITRSTF